MTPCERPTARQFLRSYFGWIVIGFILISGVSSWHLSQTIAEYQKEERIAEKIWKAGGGVARPGLLAYRRITVVVLSDCKEPGGLPENINELRYLQHLNLRKSRVVDADLEHLRGLDQLEILSLRETQISNSGLENLKGLAKLRVLDLTNTPISDAGLKHLKGMNISILVLGDAEVTEAGIEHLKDMKNLRQLSCDITPENREKLQKLLPKCTIMR